ncbi:hypothetical protein L1887_04856 [Cichorium endivia]|nr:hypothetical protein L1887_04856 [Cichorium endivia]
MLFLLKSLEHKIAKILIYSFLKTANRKIEYIYKKEREKLKRKRGVSSLRHPSSPITPPAIKTAHSHTPDNSFSFAVFFSPLSSSSDDLEQRISQTFCSFAAQFLLFHAQEFVIFRRKPSFILHSNQVFQLSIQTPSSSSSSLFKRSLVTLFLNFKFLMYPSLIRDFLPTPSMPI